MTLATASTHQPTAVLLVLPTDSQLEALIPAQTALMAHSQLLRHHLATAAQLAVLLATAPPPAKLARLVTASKPTPAWLVSPTRSQVVPQTTALLALLVSSLRLLPPPVLTARPDALLAPLCRPARPAQPATAWLATTVLSALQTSSQLEELMPVPPVTLASSLLPVPLSARLAPLVVPHALTPLLARHAMLATDLPLTPALSVW